jgi:conjugative relaxase-like TrwC/TraI family protein
LLGKRKVEVAPEREHCARQRQDHEAACDHRAAQLAELALQLAPQEAPAGIVLRNRGVDRGADLRLQPRLLVQPDLERYSRICPSGPIRIGSVNPPLSTQGRRTDLHALGVPSDVTPALTAAGDSPGECRPLARLMRSMLSIGKLAAGPTAGRYYVEQVAQGREDYYSGEGEAPGAWLGYGAQALGLGGEVDEGGIERLLSGRDPASGAELRTPPPTGAVAGFDLTFKAPKSVSIIFGIAEPGVVRELVAAHEAAVRDALGYLERKACATRRRIRGRVTQLDGHGFVAAAFRHRASRAGDPLLHTHVVVANCTQTANGRWGALDARPLYLHAKTAGYLYQASLRYEVTRRLGLAWQPVEHGVADLVGVSREVIEHFSRRRSEILTELSARGEHSARAAQMAALNTRRSKDYNVLAERLRAEWQARAVEHGLDMHALRRVLEPPLPRLSDDDVADWLAGPHGLTEQASTFSRRDVAQAFAEAARQGEPASLVEERADAFLDRDDVIAVATTTEPRFTTAELLKLEAELLDGADRRSDQDVGVAAKNAHDVAIEARPALSAEQQKLVRRLACDGRGVEVVRAAAGTGKTYALDGAREAWQRSGIPVIGCALSARAACELRDQARVDATTIARLRHALDHGAELQRGAVLVVDEAGMVGTRDLAALACAAEHSDVKLVLVGDDRQLPEIDAGGAFRALADRVGAVELHDVRRQDEQWDREALAALRRGDVERFAREYHDHGRLVAAPTAESARDALVEDWWQAHQRGEQALMIALRRSDVADLNERARGRLRDAGALGVEQAEPGERSFAVGDRVIAGRNDRTIGVTNGDTGRITALVDDRLTVALDDGRSTEIPRGYADDGHLDHGYAITAHRAQGATVDRAFVLGSDELYREWGYTALSRHRAEARFYVSAQPRFLNQAPEPLTSGNELVGAVERMLADSRAEHLAQHGLERDVIGELLEHRVAEAVAERASYEERLSALGDERGETHWWQRARRGQLDVLQDAWERARDHWSRDAIDATEQLGERRAPEPAELLRAHDPLAALDLAAPAPDLDRGMDLGL